MFPRIGLLVQIASTDDIPAELRGAIGEVETELGPQVTEDQHTFWGYRVRINGKPYCVIRRGLLPLSAPGDPSRNDDDYDGYKPIAWDQVTAWQPKGR